MTRTRSTSRSPTRRPSLEHPFGTDKFGRDLFTRTAIGGRVSIAIAFGATLAILFIGVVYGSISGFVGGRLDNGMMRFLDALYGLPYLPFAIITLAIIGTTNIWTMVIALSIASWFTTARIVRGQVITLKENDYVRAAKAVGARWYRVLGRHLLPNTLGVLIIAIFLELPGVILGEAFLSFIGLGISPPDASWGAMAQEGRTRLPHAPDRDHRAVARDRVARHLRQLHRGRPPRRPRPRTAGYRNSWRRPGDLRAMRRPQSCPYLLVWTLPASLPRLQLARHRRLRVTTCGRTSSPARAPSARWTASTSPSTSVRRSGSSASRAPGSR